MYTDILLVLPYYTYNILYIHILYLYTIKYIGKKLYSYIHAHMTVCNT